MNYFTRVVHTSFQWSRSIFLIFLCSIYLIPTQASANLKSRVLGVVTAVTLRKAPLSPAALQEICRSADPVCQRYTEKYDERFFDIHGDSYRKADRWDGVLRGEFDEDTEFREGNRNRTLKLFSGELGGYDFFHAYNVVYGTNRTPQVNPIIVDSTYLQFFKHEGYPEGVDPVFVGTQQELIELVRKYRKHVKLNHMQTSLHELDAERFVETMWPIWGHQ